MCKSDHYNMNNLSDLPDIQQRIKFDFDNKTAEANIIINAAIIQTNYLNHPRILRCILFLAKGDMDNLKKYIDIAIQDPRDVMLWAEYTDLHDGQTPKRIRDFNKTFEFCETDVKE
jgi:hypothetical protein